MHIWLNFADLQGVQHNYLTFMSKTHPRRNITQKMSLILINDGDGYVCIYLAADDKLAYHGLSSKARRNTNPINTFVAPLTSISLALSFRIPFQLCQLLRGSTFSTS